MVLNKHLYLGFEGGAVYTAEVIGKFLVIIDESAMADMLSEEELNELNLVKTIEFSSEAERTTYLNKRFNK